MFNNKRIKYLEEKITELEKELKKQKYSSILDEKDKPYYCMAGVLSKLTITEIVEDNYRKIKLLEKHLGVSFEKTKAKESESELVLVVNKSKLLGNGVRCEHNSHRTICKKCFEELKFEGDFGN